VLPPRLFRTSSFRLTLLYAVLFSASVIVLFAVIFWSTSFYMTGQLDAAIDSDFAELTEGFRAGGAAQVARLIADRVNDMPSGPMFYLLEDPAGAVVAGNLPSLPPRTGAFDTVDPRPAPHRDNKRPLRAHGTVLKGGDYLLVAIGAGQRDEMGELILRAFGWGALVSLLLAFGGGLMLSSRLLRRVEAFSHTAREIMAGHLSRRVPTRGADDEFDHLAASLNAMLERTESSMHAMQQISNDIAHDLRTPLTRLRQRLELALFKATTFAELRAAIDGSIGDTEAILATFGALLRIAQIEGGAIKAGFAEFDLSELLRTLIEVYQPAADEKHQILCAAIAPGLAAFGDRELLAQMLANLLENAMRHSPGGAVVRLSATCHDDAVTVVLSDSGPGIPPPEYENVFRRFYRLETSRTTPGDGLGLSLVSAIAVLHGISIELADNRPGLRVTLRWRGARDADPRRSNARRRTCMAGTVVE
jgi:signal transduction histidine kinase